MGKPVKWKPPAIPHLMDRELEKQREKSERAVKRAKSLVEQSQGLRKKARAVRKGR